MTTERESSYAHKIIDQNWKDYSSDEHESWKMLFERQIEVLQPLAYPDYLKALETLGFTSEKIPNIHEVNERLREITGWEVVITEGLIYAEPFFNMLYDRKFPVGRFIRNKDQLDYLEEPDLFHDFFGHIPLLTNEAYAGYLHEYGRGGERAIKFKTKKNLARLNWWTIEFGLMQTEDGLKLYGAGLCSSYSEAKYCMGDPSAHHVKFNLERCMRTRAYINDFQATYFVIDSFEDLFEQAVNTDFTSMYQSFKGMGGLEKAELYLPFDLLPTDDVIRKGTQEYINPKRTRLTKEILGPHGL